MDQFNRIEAETETHRTQKAIKSLTGGAELPLAHGVVAISLRDEELQHPAAQHLVSMLVHLLARMKGVVHRILLPKLADHPILKGVPLTGPTLSTGLTHLVGGLLGPRSQFATELTWGDPLASADVTVGIGTGGVDLVVAADAWRALFGSYTVDARWTDACPLGPYLAAAIASAEVLKRLLHLNFGWNEGAFLQDQALSLVNYAIDRDASPGPDVAELVLNELAIAGAGAGGTAALYTLGSFPNASGQVIVVEPGFLKESNLGRYLMSDYEQVHGHAHKLDSVCQFLDRHAPSIAVVPERSFWHDVPRHWRMVLATVDTPEGRWDVQQSHPKVILEAGVMNTLYAALRVVPGGWCLECKHPRDPDISWKRRSLRWGLPIEEIRRRHRDRTRVSRADLEHLAQVQGRPVQTLLKLEGVPFDEVPVLTECGETPLSLNVPSQAPVMPFATTAAGVVLAAEVVKDVVQLRPRLNNYFVHDLRYRPRADARRFKPRIRDCPGCGPA